jgi:hypothetical protein
MPAGPSRASSSIRAELEPLGSFGDIRDLDARLASLFAEEDRK